VALGMLLSPMCLCHQAVQFGTGESWRVNCLWSYDITAYTHVCIITIITVVITRSTRLSVVVESLWLRRSNSDHSAVSNYTNHPCHQAVCLYRPNNTDALCSLMALVCQETRNSSGDKIANVNFLYDDIVHILQNTIDSYINSATNRRGYVLERMFTKFSEIAQYNGHYVVQGHSRSLADFGTNRKLIYDFLLVINTNLPPSLHRFQVMADYSSNFR